MRARTVLVLAGAGLVAYRIRQRGWRLVEHDLVDHPLMTLWPALGDRLHDRDEDEFDPNDPGPRCIGCGCTDLAACDPPCWWAQLDPPVCSACEARSTVLPAPGFDPVEQIDTAHQAIAAAMEATMQDAIDQVVAKGEDPEEWTFRLDERAPLGVIRIVGMRIAEWPRGPLELWPTGRRKIAGHYRADTLGADAFNRADEGGAPSESVAQQVAIENSLGRKGCLPHEGGDDPTGSYHQGRMADCTDPVCQRGPRTTVVWTERASDELLAIEQQEDPHA